MSPKAVSRRGRTPPSNRICCPWPPGSWYVTGTRTSFWPHTGLCFQPGMTRVATFATSAVVRNALPGADIDADAVLSEVEAGWPAKVVRDEHERAVSELEIFGVPTFVVGSDAVFVRLMNRPGGDGRLAQETIERVIGLLRDQPELNEFKHTRLAI